MSDLERVCDYLIVLVGSRVQVAGEVSTLLAAHRRLSGPRRDPACAVALAVITVVAAITGPHLAHL